MSDIKKTTYSFNSKSDGLALSVLRFEPENPTEIKGIVQLVHGMNEYKERYIPFMEFLAGNGYICVIHDHRGHGHSVEKKEDLGYWYKGGYEALIEDIHDITLDVKTYVRNLTGKNDLKYILLGHSMGSMAVRCYLQRYDEELSKLIVVGCPSKQAGMGFGLALTKLVKAIKGERSVSGFIAALVMGGYEKKFAKENLPHSWVNSDPEEVKKYGADPYCNYVFTLQGFENLIKLTMETYKKSGYVMNNPSLPIRFYSGADDPCAGSEKAFFQAVDLIKKQGYTDVEGKLYEGMRHEILNEKNKDMVYKEMFEFIDK